MLSHLKTLLQYQEHVASSLALVCSCCSSLGVVILPVFQKRFLHLLLLHDPKAGFVGL